VSPVGGWLAYWDDDTGRPEIFVRPFPGPGPRIPISKDGGGELYFVNGDKFMVSDLTLAPSFAARVPRQLYEAPFMVGPERRHTFHGGGGRPFPETATREARSTAHAHRYRPQLARGTPTASEMRWVYGGASCVGSLRAKPSDQY